MCRTGTKHCRHNWTPERRALENARARICRNAQRATDNPDRAAEYERLGAAATAEVARLQGVVAEQPGATPQPPAAQDQAEPVEQVTPAVEEASETPDDTPPEAESTRVEMVWTRRKGSSLNYGNFGATFGQDIEPTGRYITQRADGGNYPDDLYDTGTITFENPIHIDFGGDYGEESNWKTQLSARYKGKKGKALSLAIIRDGYDAIITSDSYGTSEIVDLTAANFRR